MDFKEIKLDEELLQGITEAGYVTCTPVQEEVLKKALDNVDLYVQSQTGTGKTAAYLIPIIQEMLGPKIEKAYMKKVLILAPTRELAVQINEEAKTLIAHTSISTGCFYGGVGYDRQIAALKKGVDIIIGTPGRVIDLQESHRMDLSKVSFLVIDEADRMFDMGFYPDLRKLITVLPKAENRQTMLFSATLNSYVKNLAWEYTRNAQEITIEAENITVSEIGQELIHVSSDEKMKLLLGILTHEKPESVLIFCNTKRNCEVVAKRLRVNGFQSEFIIGDLPQVRRLKVLNSFKEGRISILVATDVAARGIDVNDLAMVVNYDLPNEAENYVHRIGRTARAGKAGKAYTFCSEQNVYNLPPIERYIEMEIPSKVADPSMLVKDKSEDVYIRTEFGREDRDYSSSDRRGPSNRRGSYRKGRPDYKQFSRDKSKSGKSGNYRRTSRGPEVHRESDAKNLQNMEKLSFDERMKLYKKKYGNTGSSAARNMERSKKSGTSAPKRHENAAGVSQKNSRKKKQYNTNNHVSGNQNAGSGKKNGYPKNYTSAKMEQPYKNSLPASKTSEKKGFIKKLKFLFGKKN